MRSTNWELGLEMNPVHSIRAILHEGLAQASRGLFQEALSCIEDGLQRARELGDAELVALLARNAGVVCESAGWLRRAEPYYQVAQEASPSDPYIHFALGHLYHQLGKPELGKEHYQVAHRIAGERNDAQLLQALTDVGFTKGEQE